MDLSCAEHMEANEPESPRIPPPPQPLVAPVDPMISTDPRIIPNLLIMEKCSMPTCDYFQHVQDDIQPFMRKVVTTWMLEVCEEQSCEEQVFPMAVNYLDRVLCVRAIPRHQLQLLASATLLLASKIRQGIALPVDLLCTYTDNSITPDELRQWEMLVLQLLQWQTFGVTAFDFIEQILSRTFWSSARSLIRRHAHTLAALCYTDTDFMLVPPSLTATACIMAATRGLRAGIISTTIGNVSTNVNLTYSSASIASNSVDNISPQPGRSSLTQSLNLPSDTPPVSVDLANNSIEVATIAAPSPSGSAENDNSFLLQNISSALPACVDGLPAVCSLTTACPQLAERAIQHVERLVARETAPPKTPNTGSPANPPGTPNDVQDVLFD